MSRHMPSWERVTKFSQQKLLASSNGLQSDDQVMEHQDAISAVAGLDGEDVLLLGYAGEVVDELHPGTVIEGVDNKLGRAICQAATNRL